MSERPLVIGPLYGWRRWDLDPATAELRSVYSDYIWPPRRAAMSECRQGVGANPHARPLAERSPKPPRLHCSCGLYSSRKPCSWPDGMFYVTRPFGRVALWGLVVVHAAGHRSEFAYPVELWLPFGWWPYREALRKNYGIPVHRAIPLVTTWWLRFREWRRRRWPL